MTSKMCEKCGKSFSTNVNLRYHMKRKNPCVLQEEDSKSRFECNRCDEKFKCKHHLNDHLNRKNPCIVKKSKTSEVEVELRILFELLREENENLKTKVDKLENKSSSNININSNSNNINTTNVSINVYGNEDMSHMTDVMYICCFRQMQKSIETLFRMKHFSNKMESNQNMYITNLRDAYMMTYNGKNWNKVNRIKTLTDIYYTLKDDLLGIVETMREEKTIDADLDKHFKWFIEEELSDEMEERFVKASCEQMACTAYNNRHFPMKIKNRMEKERKSII